MRDEITPDSFRYRALLQSAERGGAEAAFELGLVWSSGTGGFAVDLIQAHKWFNLATVWHHEAAAGWRQEVAEEMTAREIVEAQKQARVVLYALRPAAMLKAA